MLYSTSPKSFISRNNNAVIINGVVDRFGAYYICDNAWGGPEKKIKILFMQFYAFIMQLFVHVYCMHAGST